MRKNIFAVCDLEVDYALNFMDYLNQKKNIPFEIQAFTTVESLIAYGRKTHIELLLISGKAMCREVRELDIGKMIILSEGVHPPELDSYPSVYKYQSSSDVIREVMACYGEEKKALPQQFCGPLSENFLCTGSRTDPGPGEGGSVFEPGGIFRLRGTDRERFCTQFERSSLLCASG